jgi:hypothetical protein
MEVAVNLVAAVPSLRSTRPWCRAGCFTRCIVGLLFVGRQFNRVAHRTKVDGISAIRRVACFTCPLRGLGFLFMNKGNTRVARPSGFASTIADRRLVLLHNEATQQRAKAAEAEVACLKERSAELERQQKPGEGTDD